MAKKSWSVTTDEGTFSVDLNGSKLSINGAPPQRLTKFAKKTHFVDTEYTIPLGNRTATLFIQSLASPVLAYNGTNCATGQPWEYQKIPAWGWIFIVLDIIAVITLGGSVWLTLLAIIVTVVTIRSKLNVAVKVILALVITLAVAGLGAVIATLLTT